MDATIQLKLFATLQALRPPGDEAYPIRPGTPIRDLLRALGIEESQAKLIFVNGVQARPEDTLQGGERVGIFPPVGGG
jgi:sulfur carrier protein ThiS